MENILSELMQLCEEVIDMFGFAWDALNTKLVDLPYFTGNPVEGSVFDMIRDFILNVLGLGDYTLLTFMLGAGIGMFIAVSVAKWVIGIVM